MLSFSRGYKGDLMVAMHGRSQDVSLRGVSVRAKRAGYAGTFLG